MKDVAKRRKRGFAIGESDEARKEEIRRKEEKREAKEMENRINKVSDLSVRFVDRVFTSSFGPLIWWLSVRLLCEALDSPLIYRSASSVLYPLSLHSSLHH